MYIYIYRLWKTFDLTANYSYLIVHHYCFHDIYNIYTRQQVHTTEESGEFRKASKAQDISQKKICTIILLSRFIKVFVVYIFKFSLKMLKNLELQNFFPVVFH